MDAGPGSVVTVLHVDDDPAMLEVSAEMLERENEQFAVEMATGPTAALDRLAESPPVDCVVSDYQMPEMNGLDLLEAVHDAEPDLPFVLFTGKGSEEIASEAISAGVTDYIQKSTATDQFTVLANRIENAVAQRRAKREVERTKQRYRTLISESSDVIAVVDPDGSVQYVSPAVDRVLGYAQSDLVGEHVFEHVHPADSGAVERVLTDSVAEPALEPTAEFRFRRGDGSWTRLEVECRNLLAADVIGGIVLYARDVTERAERQAELERYELIVEVAGDGAYVLDDAGRYEMVNEKTVDRTGYSEDELVGTHGSLVLDESDIQRAEDAVLGAYRSDDVDFAQFEATVHARDGTEYPVEIRTAPIVEDGRIVGAVGVSRDIAARKERERELERYEKIVETAGDVAHVIDADGNYVLVNDAFVERTGYARDELIGSHVRTVIDDADYQRGRDAIKRVLETDGRDFAELEITVETRTGDRFPATARLSPIVEDGEIRGSVGIVREQTDATHPVQDS